MSNRERLQRAIRLCVTRAVKRGQKVDVDRLALSLSSKYPQSGMPLHVICQQIETMVAEASASTERRGGSGGAVTREDK